MKKFYFPINTKWFFIFFIFKITFTTVYAQDCTNDSQSPFFSLKSNYTISLDNSIDISLSAKDLVSLCIDNCTLLENMKFSFSKDAQDQKMKVVNSPGLKISVQVYATDQAGNQSSASTEITVTKCTPSLVCNDLVKFDIQAGEALSIDVDNFLEGSYCKDHIFDISYKVGNNSRSFTQIDETLPRSFQYTVLDSNSGNSCWGNVVINIQGSCDPALDFEFTCNPIQTNCFKEVDPMIIGFPFSTLYKIERVSDLEYSVQYSEFCPKVSVLFTDKIIQRKCADTYVAEIERSWIAKIPGGVNKVCLQTIQFQRTNASLFSNLQNYDGLELPTLNCKDTWQRMDGYIPDPAFSGSPVLDLCHQFGQAYSDTVLIGFSDVCGTHYKIIRQWTVLNWCSGENFMHTQIFKVYCGTDSIPPVAVCNSNLILNVPPTGEITVFPDLLDAGSYDNCSEISFSFDSAGLVKSEKFDILDSGKKYIKILFVTDLAGNRTYCLSTLEIVAKANGPNSKNILGGRILNYQLQSSASTNRLNFNFKLKSGADKFNLYACGEPINFPNLNYSLCIDTSKNPQEGYLIPELISSPPFLGVTTFDLVQIIRRLFGQIKFNSYESIAADVDCDNKITIFDIFDIRRFILGSITKFKCESVQLYTADILNPIKVSDQNIVNLPRFDFDIVPVIKGDVNGSSFFFRNELNEYRSAENFKFFVDNFSVRQGEEYDVWMSTAEEYNVYGIQLGQLFDENKLDVLNISSPILNLNKDVDYIINKGGDWRCLLLNSNVSLFTIYGKFLKIRVKSKFNGMLNEALSSKHFPIPLFVIGSDIELSTPQLEERNLTATSDPKTNLNSLHVYPNPFDGDLNVEFSNLENLPQNLQIYNLEGKMLYQSNQFQLDKFNRLKLNAGLFPGNGFYLLVLNNGHSIIQKLVVRN